MISKAEMNRLIGVEDRKRRGFMVTQAEMQRAVETIYRGVSEYTGQALSERDLLRYVVKFANGGLLEGPPATAPAVPPPAVADAINSQTGEPRNYEANFTAGHRAELRKNLALAIGKKELPRHVFAAALHMIDTAKEIVPQFRGRPRRHSLHIRRFYMPLSLNGILARAVLLLREDSLGLGEDLKQCRLATC